jgi:acyl-CoA thioester hydrolase
VTEPFRFRFRVRYSECDAQGIVFNARWGEYVDIAASEYTRAVFGRMVDASELDWRLVKQTTQWHAPARFDDILDARVRTVRVGTTSFVFATELVRDGVQLADCETVYVAVDVAGKKRAVPDRHRAELERGAPGVVIDQSGGSR